MSKSGGLDVEAELRYAEVQKGRASVADWTLKEREGIRKSKRDEQPDTRLLNWINTFLNNEDMRISYEHI